jgi:hypothetical protein
MHGSAASAIRTMTKLVERQEMDGVRLHSIPETRWRITDVWMSNGAKLGTVGAPFIAENVVDARRRGLQLVPCKDKGMIEKIEVERVS